MLRDSQGKPLGDWFAQHPHESGVDVETRWEGRVPHVTPVERFFVRNHTTSPDLDAASWRLLISGDGVLRESVHTLAGLRDFTAVTIDVALECTGNGRAWFGEQQGTPRPGTPWRMGAIGVASWTGVPLATLLRHAGLRDDATQVMAVGLDPSYKCEGVDYGRVRRPLPLAKALDDALVVYEMNGAALARDHGYPARLIVPGWVGIASIKWLGELRVTRAREDSPWNTRWYRMRGARWDGARADLGRMPVKGILDDWGTPRVGEAGVLVGRAWSGEAAIASVEVSTNGGRTWEQARFAGPNQVSAWTPWEFTWTPSQPGPHDVRVRATDTTGRIQPDVAADNEDGYLFDAVLRHTVNVAHPAAH